MLFRNFSTLLDVTNGGNAPITGPTWRLNPLSVDRVQDHEQEVLIVVDGAHADGGTDPSVQVIVETSADGVTWHTVWTDQFTQESFQGVGRPVIGPTGGSNELNAVMTYVRARSVPWGGPNPNQDRVVVRLGSTAPLRLRPA